MENAGALANKRLSGEAESFLNGGGEGSRTPVLDAFYLDVYMCSWRFRINPLGLCRLTNGVHIPINLLSLTVDPVTRSSASPLFCRLFPQWTSGKETLLSIKQQVRAR